MHPRRVRAPHLRAVRRRRDEAAVGLRAGRGVAQEEVSVPAEAQQLSAALLPLPSRPTPTIPTHAGSNMILRSEL